MQGERSELQLNEEGSEPEHPEERADVKTTAAVGGAMDAGPLYSSLSKPAVTRAPVASSEQDPTQHSQLNQVKALISLHELKVFAHVAFGPHI